MTGEETIRLIRDVTAPIIADYVREVRELKQQLRQVQRQIVAVERMRRNRELVRQAESDCDDY